MRFLGRLGALSTILAMPAVAWALARAALALWARVADAPGGAWFVEDGISFAAAAGGACVAGYLALTGYAMLLGALARGGRAIPSALLRCAPGSWRRMTVFALGLGMSAGVAGPALAAEASAPAGPGWADSPVAAAMEAPSDANTTDIAGIAGLVTPPPADAAAWDSAARTSAETETSVPSTDVGWATTDPAATQASASTASASTAPEPPAPERSASETPASPASAAPASTAPAYVVQHGESLWLITSSLLGPDATDAQVAAAWPELYEANRNAIGADPSLIHAGLALTVPAGFTS